jgi:hypothetical protein
VIISVDELKQYITTDKTDQVLEAMLQALELMIRSYTNNNFQNRNKRFYSDIEGGVLLSFSYPYLSEGDTVQISESKLNDGLYILSDNMGLLDEKNVLVTKVEYPADVKMGVVNLAKWELENREKVGIQSESISRHSVTYFNMDWDNSVMGYPKSLLGFLRPYMKARF